MNSTQPTGAHHVSTLDFTAPELRSRKKILFQSNTGTGFQASVACMTEPFDLRKLWAIFVNSQRKVGCRLSASYRPSLNRQVQLRPVCLRPIWWADILAVAMPQFPVTRLH